MRHLFYAKPGYGVQVSEREARKLTEKELLQARVEVLENCLEKLVLWNYGHAGNDDPLKWLKSVVSEAEELLEATKR